MSTIHELSTLNFLKTAFTVLFIGPPCVGKTFLAVALGLKAASSLVRTLCYTAEELVGELIAVEVSKRVEQFLGILSRIDLVITDELWYLQMANPSAALFLRLMIKRYEKC